MLSSIVYFVYSGMNGDIHDMLNVVRLDPEGSNHCCLASHACIPVLCYLDSVFSLQFRAHSLQQLVLAHRREERHFYSVSNYLAFCSVLELYVYPYFRVMRAAAEAHC